jgi:hypothetical protein
MARLNFTESYRPTNLPTIPVTGGRVATTGAAVIEMQIGSLRACFIDVLVADSGLRKPIIQ